VNRSAFKVMLGVLSALGLIQSAPGLAQAPAAAASTAGSTATHSAEGDMSEIIVTARRVEERLQDVPISITVFNQQQLSNQNVVNASDLAAFTPSLSSNNNFGSQNSSFAIRGFVQDNGTAPSVGTYFADVVAPRGASNGLPSGDGAGPGSFFDLQNVQVLKGPQGTLFGRNTTGGAVLLVPQKPTDKLEGYVEGSVGNYDMNAVQAVVNIPVNDQFRFRLGVDHQQRKGYMINTSGIGPSDFSDVDYTALRASAVVNITPDLENYTIASFVDSNTNGDVQKMIASLPATTPGCLFCGAAVAQLAAQGADFYDFRQDVANPYTKLTQWQIINTTTWNESDTLTVKNIASYAELKNDLKTALFGTNFATPAIPGFLPSFNYNFANSTPAPGDDTAHESTLTEELRLEGHTQDDRLNWQTGLYMEIARPLSTVGSQSPTVINCTNSATFQCTDIWGFLIGISGQVPAAFLPVHVGGVNLTTGRTSYRDAGLYGQTTYKFNDQFKLTGGIRYTTDDEVNDSLQQSYNFNSPAPTATNPLPLPTIPSFHCTNPLAVATNCYSHFSQGTHAPTWLIDLDYTPVSDVLAYAKYARGYRAGTIAPNVSAPYNYIQAEKVDTYEIGAKTSFAEPVHGTFDIAAFYNDFSNQQLQLGFNPAQFSGVSPTAAPINAGKSRIYGLEIDASVTPFEGFRLDAGYTYLDTSIQSVQTFAAQAGSPFLVSGNYRVGDPLALSPKNKYSITGTYTLPLGDSIGKISLGVNFVHTDEMFSNPSDRTSPDPVIQALSTLQATNLVNVNADWKSIAGRPVDLSLFATNVTNKQYYTYIPGLAAPGGAGFETAEVGPPRMYGLRVRFHFDEGTRASAAPAMAAAAPAPVAPPPPVVAAPAPAPVVAPPPPPPADSDGDGVPDSLDKCPNTPHGDKVDAEGCSLAMNLQVNFETNSADIKSDSYGELDRFVQFLKEVPSAHGELQGHTDSVGKPAYNLALSQRRADAVKSYVVDKGVDGARLTTKGYGQTQPVASNKTKEGRAQNRRVLFVRPSDLH